MASTVCITVLALDIISDGCGVDGSPNIMSRATKFPSGSTQFPHQQSRHPFDHTVSQVHTDKLLVHGDYRTIMQSILTSWYYNYLPRLRHAEKIEGVKVA